MTEINLGYGYRLKRLDSMNWELWHYHETKSDNGRKGCKVGEKKWHRCKKYYQKLSTALLAVYELVLREDDGEAVDLEEALARAEEIEKSLNAASVNLLNLWGLLKMRNSNDFNTLNNPLEIRCKCDDLRLPKYAHLGDAGADLRADIPSAIKIWPHESAWIDTGVCVEIPSGYVGLQFARSGLGMKHNVCLANGVGVIDSGYRGRIRAKLINLGDKPYMVHPGDRVCQLAIVPFVTCSYTQVDELDETERGANGYGSTGVD